MYRATRDGFDAKDLWQRCSGKGPTLMIVKVRFHMYDKDVRMAFASSLSVVAADSPRFSNSGAAALCAGGR